MRSDEGKWVTMPLSRLVELSKRTISHPEWHENYSGPALDPADVPDGIWVAYTSEWGREYTADGNHRIAGMLRWAEEQGENSEDVEIDVWISHGEPPDMNAPRAKSAGFDPHWWRRRTGPWL